LPNFRWKSTKILRHDDQGLTPLRGELRRLSGPTADMTLKKPHQILSDETPVLIRRLVPEDAALYPDFLSEVTVEDLRLRFFASMRQVNHELLDKLINYDPARAMAFIAMDERSRKMLGVVRLHDDTDGGSAEFAVLVRSRLKGHGVGWLLMQRMIEYAKQKGLKTVRGQVLSENAAMLAMCAELGFHIDDNPDDFSVQAVTLPVGTAASRTAAS
jgi:RimJ/RimL family protein N-acetyltransferase